MISVKNIFQKEGKDGCRLYFQRKFDSDLSYHEERYNKYCNVINDKQLISEYISEYDNAVSEYKSKTCTFILKLYKLPHRNFFMNFTFPILCSTYIIFLLYMTKGSNILLWLFLFLCLFSIIKKARKRYGNSYYEKLDKMLYEIEYDCDQKLCEPLNKMHNKIVDIQYGRKE